MIPLSCRLAWSPLRCLTYIVISPEMASTIMAMKPANLPITMEKTMNPMKETPMAPAAYVRNLPLIPMNSNGR